MIEPYPVELDLFRKYKLEGGAILKNGRLLRRIGGVKGMVPMSDNANLLAYQKTFTHNHPESKCFSFGDLQWAAEYEVGEMRVVCRPNCTIYSMVPNTPWNADVWEAKYVPTINRVFKEKTGEDFDCAKSNHCRFTNNRSDACRDTCCQWHTCWSYWDGTMEWFYDMEDVWRSIARECDITLDKCYI